MSGSSPALSIPSYSGIKRVQNEGGAAMRRILGQHVGAGEESPSVLRVQSMRKLLTAVQHRIGNGARGNDGGGMGEKATDVDDKAKMETKTKNQIVPKTLFGGEEGSAHDAGPGVWWDAQFEKRQQLAQQQSIDRLHSRLLNCRLSRDGAAGDFNAAANVDNKNENGHGMVTPLKQGSSAANRAEAMRLTIAVPGAAECNVDRPLDRESGANP